MLKRSLRGRQAGLSLVELLVGVAVGLFIVGGAIKVFVDYVGDGRRLLVETRVNQDLRAAADLIARDLRRSGYWGSALNSAASAPAAPNPYIAIARSGAANASVVTYSYSQNVENDAKDSDEFFGFQLRGNAIETQVGNGNWQKVTDPDAVRVTRFSVTPVERIVQSSPLCRVVVRRYDIVLRGQAPPNTNMNFVREIRESIRPRNDELRCP